MSKILMGQELGPLLIKQLGLPDYTVWLELRVAVNEPVTVKCCYYPDQIDPNNITELFAKYELHKKEP